MPFTANDEQSIRTALGKGDAGLIELHDAVVVALENGATVREVADLTGLPTSTIKKWQSGG